MPAPASQRRPPPKHGEARAHINDHIALLHVKDFKSLKEVNIELSQVNVFIGANGSGKSSLLEAIGLLGAASAGRIDDQALLRRGVRPGVPELYKSAFRKEKIASYITLEATSNGGSFYSASITNPIKKPQPWWQFYHETIEHRGRAVASRGPRGAKLLGEALSLESHSSVAAATRSRMEVNPAVRAFLAALDDYAIFTPVTPVLRGIAPDSAPRNPVGLFGGQLPEAVARLTSAQGKVDAKRFLNEALKFVDWAREFEVTEPSRRFISPSVPTMRLVMKFHDRFMSQSRNGLSGYDASEGALYILFSLVLALHDQSPRVLAIDNFDQALNPRTAKGLSEVFARAAIQRGRQVFLTTHNPLVLDGLPLGDPRVRLFTAARDAKGHTRIKHVPVPDLKSLKEKYGEDAVSRMWLMGRIGGMPGHVEV